VRKSGGIFDVVVDDQKIYSKYDTGTFPSEKEIVEMLRKR
jgi:selT/selW/selH-like putative selenoprotein